MEVYIDYKGREEEMSGFVLCFTALTTYKTFSAGLGELKVMRDWAGSEAFVVMSVVLPGRTVN